MLQLRLLLLSPLGQMLHYVRFQRILKQNYMLSRAGKNEKVKKNGGPVKQECRALKKMCKITVSAHERHKIFSHPSQISNSQKNFLQNAWKGGGGGGGGVRPEGRRVG